MRQAYRPPVQGGFGQFVDSIVLLVLVGLSLLAPLLFASAESGAAKAAEAPPTWETLGQNPTMIPARVDPVKLTMRFVTSVRGKGCEPTMTASSGLGVSAFMKAGFLRSVIVMSVGL